MLRAKITEEHIKTALRLFYAEGIEPILIKGWAAAREYPLKHERFFGDIDLCVAPEVYEKAKKLLERTEAAKLNIDLHCGLRHLDTVVWEKLFKNSEVVYLDEVPVRILCSEDHLRVLCVHWLTDGGAYREKLLDIFYILQNNLNKFDWDKCLGAVDEKRRGWIIKTIAVVHKEHPLDISKLPFAEELDSIPVWFSRALEKEWASGTKLQPIHAFIGSRKGFWEQFKKRVPPNAIAATVAMDGEFDDSQRLYYQFGSIFLRLKPSIGKTIRFFRETLLKKFKKNA